MKISIQNEISQKYPNYKMGLIKVVISHKNWEKLQTLTKYDKSILNEDVIEKEWLKVFADMNASERRLPSVAALWSVINRFGKLKPISYFVDAYNYISIKHGIPMGGYDMKKLPDKELSLRYATQNGVRFEPMGLSGQLEKIKDTAEICYYCGDIPVCRYWNHKDSEITKIDDNTAEALIMFDTLNNLSNLKTAMNEFVELIKATANVTEVKIDILDNKKISCKI